MHSKKPKEKTKPKKSRPTTSIAKVLPKTYASPRPKPTLALETMPEFDVSEIKIPEPILPEEENVDLFGPVEQELQKPVGIATNVKTQFVVVERTWPSRHSEHR